jgi:hypothetical protein
VIAALPLLLLPALFRAPAPVEDDLGARLSELSAPRAEDRARAERWLGIHLRPGDYPQVAAAAAEGGVEVRRRLARALGADDRHLALAAHLLTESRAGLVEVGELAVEELVERWRRAPLVTLRVDDDDAAALKPTPDPRPAGAERGLGGIRLRQALRALAEEKRTVILPPGLDVDPGGFAGALARVARLARMPLGLAIEPGLAGLRNARSVPDPDWTGDWPDALEHIVRRHGLALEAFGIDAKGRAGRGAFVHVVARDREGEETLHALLARWCRELQAAPDAERRVEAARALAGTRWPAALAWMEARWRDAGDSAAREGVLVAATLERQLTALADPAVVAELLRDADAALVAGAPDDLAQAHLVLDALARGTALGPGGASLAPTLLADWDAASPRARWLRLAILEGRGVTAAARESVRAVTDDLLAAPPGTHAPYLLRQALQTRVRLALGAPDRPPSPAIADPAGLLSAAGDATEARELLRLLARAGAAPSAAPLESELARVTLAGWWLEVGDVPAAAAELAALGVLAGPAAAPAQDLAADVLSTWARPWGRADGRARMGELLALLRARAAGSVDPIADARLGLLLGVRRLEDPTGAASDEQGAAPGWPQPDYAELGARGGQLAPGPGSAAREELVGLLERAVAEGWDRDALAPLLAACERAVEELAFAGWARQSELFRYQLGAVLTGQRAAPLSKTLRARRWPRAPGPPPMEPRARERRLDPAWR